ncbi:MAG: PaaI family thioesterase [Proteobacteria bacterium]|nr:PaaI family thioesterase [Pseudomonadota bacterium]
MYRKRIEEIIKGDKLFHLYGMEVLSTDLGYARLQAEVKEEHLNAHNIAHGAMIFALMDVAFAISVNSYEDAVGIQFGFNIFKSTGLGDVIIAESKVIHKGRSSMVVEVKAESKNTGKILAKGMATALPLPKKIT